jgi:hypothetical protein
MIGRIDQELKKLPEKLPEFGDPRVREIMMMTWMDRGGIRPPSP